MRIHCLAMLMLLCSIGQSQTVVPRFENIGINDGLAHSTVYSILQDRKGFMWFGTPNGLSRYDGERIRSFRYQNALDLTGHNNYIRGSLFEDQKGNIWYSNEGGIYKWDRISEKVVREWNADTLQFRNTEFRLLYLDLNENLWLFNSVLGIIKYSIPYKKFSFYALPSGVKRYNYPGFFSFSTNDGYIWMKLGDVESPIISFNIQNGEYTTHFDDSKSYAFFIEGNTMVKSISNGLIKMDLQNGSRYSIDFSEKNIKKEFLFKSMIIDKKGRWWLATFDEGLMSFDEKNGTFNSFKHNKYNQNSLPFDITTCLYIDRSENLWIGTDGGGVGRLDLKESRFRLFPVFEGTYPQLKDFFIKSLYEDENGRIWFGTHTSGLNIFDPQKGTLKNFINENGKMNSLPGNVVSAIFKDQNGNMWIGHDKGISIFNEKSESFQNILIEGLKSPFVKGSSFIYKIVQLKNGDILCATYRGVIKIIKERSGSFKAVAIPGILSNSTDIVETYSGNWLITLPWIGLIEVRETADTLQVVKTHLAGIDLRSISPDNLNNNKFWIGSGIGLIHFDWVHSTYELYDENVGLANNYVYGLIQDSIGSMWVSTNKGLSYFSPKTKSFENYTFLHGLQSNEFNTNAYHKGKSGLYYFGGIKGFNWFDPTLANRQQFKPEVAITRVEINGVVFQSDSDYILKNKIKVPHSQNNFSFEFAALDFTLPLANKIQFQLEGWDASPVISQEKIARYSNLPPGNYILKVKASNADGIWSDEMNLSIQILAPFWKRKEFIWPIGALGVGFILYGTMFLSRIRVKRKLQLLEKQIAIDAERIRIGADMHDEIGSSITHIALMSEVMQKQTFNKDNLQNDLKKISQTAHRLVQTISEIIWALNPQNDTLETFLAYVREQARQYFDPFHFEFSVNFPEEVPLVKLTNEKRRNLFLITKELLMNAIKHSEASAVHLSFSIQNKRLTFTVMDDGKGFNMNEVRQGSNGVRILRRRMEEIGGSIEWLSTIHGTTVIYSIPER